MSLCSFTRKLELNVPIDQVFMYFTDTDQFAQSLPSSLQFKILRRSARHISQGVSLDFQTSHFWMKFNWKSYVQAFTPNHRIAYILYQNALASWEHDYYFEALSGNQTWVTECILYRLPFGVLGDLINRLWVRPYLDRLFDHRRTSLNSIFQKWVQNSPSTTKSISSTANEMGK